jgi:amino acid adenylation domain-containing protein
MTVDRIISKLRNENIKISLDGDKLKIRSAEAIGSDMVALLKEHKQLLVEYLKGNDKYSSIPVAAAKPYYAVSSPQKRLYILQQLDPAATGYNMPMLIELGNDVTKEKLATTFEKLIARHESLRTSFEMVDGQPVQKIHEQVDLAISEHESTNKSLAQLKSAFVRPFDLSKAPLCRVGYVQLEEGGKFLLIDMHHIITDGVSQELLAKEFAEIYAGKQLPALARQYKDYSEWMHSSAQQAKLKSQEDFWLNVFSGELPVTELPYDHARPQAKNYEGAAVSFRLNEDENNIIQNICREHEVTLFMSLLSIMNIWLARLSGSEDIVVGSPIAARKHADLHSVIGMFINTIALRNQPAADKTYRAFLQEVKAHVLQAYDNQEYGFENLVEKLAIDKQSSRNPLFDVMLVLQNQGQNQAGNVDAQHKPAPAKVDITIEAVEDKQGIVLNLNYSTALFNADSIDRFIACFRNIISALADDTIKIKEIEVLSASDRNQLIYGFNQSFDVSYPKDKTVVHLFEEQVLRVPGNTAVVSEGKTLTYAQLNESANRLAHYLIQRQGVGIGDLVGIQLERSEWQVISMLGILKAGGAYLPIDPQYPAERISYMIEDSACKYVITEETIAELEAGTFEKNNPRLPVKPNDLIYVIYTSGTTGNPKGTLLEHENVVRLFVNDSPLFDFGENDTWTVFHSTSFDFSVWEIFGALLFGGKLVMVPSMVARDPKAFSQLLREQKATVLSQTPSAFYKLIRQELEMSDSDLAVRYVVFGGEALSPGKLKDWKEKYPATRLINMFGITETTVHVTFKEITEKEITANISNIGKPIPTLSCYVLNQHGQLQPIGVPGELYVGGPGVARGYLNRDALTNQRFIASPFRTGERLYRSGDLARLTANGEMEYIGRIDNQVKIRGYRIELAEIENALLKIDGVKEAIVLVIPGVDEEKSLAAYLVAANQLDVQQVRIELSKHVPAHMIPAYFIQLDEIPLTTNGKADKNALRKLYKSGINHGVEYIAARNELEQQLIAIWEEVLDRRPIGIRHGFFELGGDSIKILRLVGQFKTRLGLDIAIADIYKHSTVEELANYISGNESSIKQRSDELNTATAAMKQKFSLLKEQVVASGILDNGNVEDVYPMSAIEKGMVFESVVKEGVGVYHDQVFFKKKFANFNIQRFEYALQLVVRKHPILRTSFNIVNFETEVQIVHKDVDVAVKFEDISNLTTQQQEARIERYLQQELKQPFNTSEAPLWRMSAFELGNDTIGFVWQFHHAILDGWSNASFLTELNNLYTTLADDPAYKPQPLTASYKDAIVQAEIDKEDKSILEFWKNELADHTRLNIFTDEDTWEQHSFYLEGNRLQKLSRTALAMNIPVRTFSLSAYLYLLKTLNYADEVVAGLVTNTRPDNPDGDKILGCFLNTIPLKLSISGHEPCTDFVRRVNQKVIDLKRYERLGLLEINQVHHGGSRSGNPFFDVMFNYVDFHIYKDVQEGQGASTANSDAQLNFERTNTYLDFTISETGGIYNGSLKLNKKLRSGLSLKRLASLYLTILNYMIDNPGQLLGKMELVNEEEKQLLHQFNNTACNYIVEGTVCTLFEQKISAKPAVICGDRKLSYDELNKQANRLATYLNLAPGDVAGIKLERSEWMIISLLAILKSGAAYVPLDPQHPADRIAYMIEDSNCKTIIDEQVLSEFRLVQNNFSDENLQRSIKPPDLAYIMYTSGTTGRPKGVRISHAAVLDFVQTLQNTFGLNEADIVLQQTSISFDVSVGEIFATLASGATMVIAQEGARDTEKLVRLIEKERITYVSTTPLVVNELNRYAERLRSIRALVSAGEELKGSHITNLIRYIDVYNAYGPTEITVLATQHKVTSLSEAGSIGYSMPNHQIHIVSDSFQLLPPGLPGEICIAGAGLADGYQNKPELIAEKFVNNPFAAGRKMYRSGDLGYWLADGKIAFGGRKDEQVKIRGYRIEVSEIENALKTHPQIDAVAVTVKQYTDGGRSLVAYLVSREELKTSALRSHVKSLLPDYMVPSFFIQVEKLPLNTSGKIDKRALASLEGTTVSTGVEYVAPQNKDEKYLVSLWADVLKVDGKKIGVHDNFFEVGGDSIKILKIFSRLQEKGYEKISVAALFQYPTISKLTEYLSAEDNALVLSEEAMADSMDVLNNSIKLLLEDGD